MPWTTDDIKRLVELEAHLRGIDPRLALALAEQESGFDPKARSPKGAMGIFQLMPKTAAGLKVDPSDVAQNISGGLDYLKQQLDAFGGDPGMAVAAYNAGPGVVQAYKGVPPYKETRGLVSRVLGKLGPASAEAASSQASAAQSAPRSRLEELEAELARRDAQQAPQATASTAQPQTAGMSRLQELEAHLARLEGQAAPQTPAPTPAPPTARSTPEQDAAYRASRGQQAQPPAEEPITPERRFLDLPSSRQMPLEERTQRFKEFYGLKPELKEEFLRSEEPPSDITVDIEKPSTPQPGAVQAPPTGPASSTRIEPLQPGASELALAEVNRPAPLPVPPEAAIAAIPGMAGYAIGAKIAPALGAIGKVVPPLLEAAGAYGGRRANVALGYEKEGALGDVLSLLPLATRSLGTATAGWLERTIKEAPVAARDQTMDLLSKLFSRGGAQGTLTYLLSGDPQLAAWVGGSYATARSLLGFALRHPIGKQLVEQTLKAGRAIGGEELGMLMNIGRTGHTATPHSTQAREGSVRPVDIAPMMNHPGWKGKLKTDQQRKEALRLWQDPATSESDRAEMLKVMDAW